MEKNQSEFIANMKYYRDKRHISQAKLAELCNCGTGTIGSIEAGRQYPSFEMLFKIAKALGVHPADLFLRDTSRETRSAHTILEDELLPQIHDFINRKFPK